MNKKTVRIILIVAGIAVAAYLALRWWSGRRKGNGNAVAPGGSTDLNSVAPELVGGSSGPEVGPAVSLPVNITLQENSAPPPQVEDHEMKSGKGNQNQTSAVHRQSLAMPSQGSGPSDAIPQEEPAGVTSPDSSGNPNGGY